MVSVPTLVGQSELQMFAQRSEQAQSTMKTGFVSAFRACNLQGALSLVEELTDLAPLDTALSQPRHATSGKELCVAMSVVSPL